CSQGLRRASSSREKYLLTPSARPAVRPCCWRPRGRVCSRSATFVPARPSGLLPPWEKAPPWWRKSIPCSRLRHSTPDENAATHGDSSVAARSAARPRRRGTGASVLLDRNRSARHDRGIPPPAPQITRLDSPGAAAKNIQNV